MSRCPECHAPVVTYADTGESACAEDPSHDFDEAEDEPWEIRSPRMAEWAMGKLALANQNIDGIVEHCDEMIFAAQAYRDREVKPWQARADFFRGHLLAWYERVRPTAKGAPKKVPLVNGEIAARDGSEVVTVPDGWAEIAYRNGWADLVRVKYEPDKAAIKKAIKAGVWVPAVSLDRNPEEVSVKPALGEVPVYLPMPDESEAA